MQDIRDVAPINLVLCIPLALLGMFVAPAFSRVSSTARLRPPQKDFVEVVEDARNKTALAKQQRRWRSAAKPKSPSQLTDEDSLIAVGVVAVVTVGLYLKYRTTILWTITGIAVSLFVASLVVIYFLSRRRVVAQGGWSGYFLLGVPFVAAGLLDVVLLRTPWFGGAEFSGYVHNAATKGIFNSGDGLLMVVYQIVGVILFLMVALLFIAFVLASIMAVYVEMGTYGQLFYRGVFSRCEWVVSKGALWTAVGVSAFSIALSSGLVYQVAHNLTSSNATSPFAAFPVAQSTSESVAVESANTSTKPNPTPPAKTIALKPARIAASKTAPDSQDDAGKVVSFAAKNMIDGVASTAWRSDGDGLGVTITMTFANSVHVTSVGLIPGYDKIDPKTNVDRFKQNRRVTSVKWSAEGKDLGAQKFTDTRTMQVEKLDASGLTTLTITITGTTASGGKDYTALSEVRVDGYAD